VALHEHGVHHRDISLGNALLSTDSSKPAGFIADYPTEREEIISKLKGGELHAVFYSSVYLTTLFLIGSYSGDSLFDIIGSALRSLNPWACQEAR
jgi:serine/threonine protein kinase